MADWKSVNAFLKDFKEKMSESGLEIVERDKTIATMAYLNMTYAYEVQELVRDLTPTDYVSGPEPDKGGFPGAVWIFSVDYDCDREIVPLYIKLKFDGETAKLLSMHRPDSPVRFPLKT